jgi:hypothetical protein
VYEGHAANVLATGHTLSSGLVLMQAGKDKVSFTLPRESRPNTTVSPFSRPRMRSHAYSANDPHALNFGDAEGKSLADTFQDTDGPEQPILRCAYY